MHPFTQNRARALSVMVGAVPGAGMMVPGLPAGNCGPPANYYPPGCSTVQRPFDQQRYNDACAARDAEARRAQSSILRANQPQIGLGINNRQNSTAASIIAGGETRTLTITPTVGVCLTKLVVSRGSAPFFTIQSLTAALTEFLADSGALPADMFSPDSLVSPVQLPFLTAGTSLTMLVTNVTSESHDFYAGFQAIPDRSGAWCL